MAQLAILDNNRKVHGYARDVFETVPTDWQILDIGTTRIPLGSTVTLDGDGAYESHTAPAGPTSAEEKVIRYARAREAWLHFERVFGSDRAWEHASLYFKRTTAGVPDLFDRGFEGIPEERLVHTVRSRVTWHWCYAALVEYVENNTASYDSMLTLEGLGLDNAVIWYANHFMNATAVTDAVIGMQRGNGEEPSGVVNGQIKTSAIMNFATVAPWWNAIKTRLPYLTAGLQGGSGLGITAAGAALPAAPILTGSSRNVLTFWDAAYPL